MEMKSEVSGDVSLAMFNNGMVLRLIRRLWSLKTLGIVGSLVHMSGETEGNLCGNNINHQ